MFPAPDQKKELLIDVSLAWRSYWESHDEGVHLTKFLVSLSAAPNPMSATILSQPLFV
jgi:hypothetical protein